MSTWTILALQLPNYCKKIPLQYYLKWPNPIHPKSSLSDLIDEQNGGTGGVDCPFAEEMPLQDANSTDL